MPPHSPESLEQQVDTLARENRALRAELDKIQQRTERRSRILRRGGGLLIPLLDRQRVARSFARLVETLSSLTGPKSSWPSRDEITAHAGEFLNACVRFVIRRRLIIFLFSVVAVSIPAFQLWLVIQQNEMIENQNEFFEIQVYDIVSRSMADTDRNASQMTGALLANAKTKFLAGVVDEVFASDIAVVLRDSGTNAVQRRLTDAASRGYLIRAVVRKFQQHGRRGDIDPDVAYASARPMFRKILQDAEQRMPSVFRLGRRGDAIDGELAEQVDYYILQVGDVWRTYGRLARTVSGAKTFYRDIQPVLARITGMEIGANNRFAFAYRTVLENFLFDLAVAPRFGDGPVDIGASKLTPEQALRKGLDRLRAGMGDEALNWGQIEQILEMQ